MVSVLLLIFATAAAAQQQYFLNHHHQKPFSPASLQLLTAKASCHQLTRDPKGPASMIQIPLQKNISFTRQVHFEPPTRTTGREHQDNYLKIIKVMVMVKENMILHSSLFTTAYLTSSTYFYYILDFYFTKYNTHTHTKYSSCPTATSFFNHHH